MPSPCWSNAKGGPKGLRVTELRKDGLRADALQKF